MCCRHAVHKNSDMLQNLTGLNKKNMSEYKNIKIVFFLIFFLEHNQTSSAIVFKVQTRVFRRESLILASWGRLQPACGNICSTAPLLRSYNDSDKQNTVVCVARNMLHRYKMV